VAADTRYACDTLSEMSFRPPTSHILYFGTSAGRYVAALAMSISIAVFQIGCAGSGANRPSTPQVSAGPGIHSLESVPEWALTSTRRDDDSEIGIGSGDTLDRATRYALQDVASRLSVSVESQLRDVYREVQGTSAESLEQVIETRVLGTRFSGWERTRSVQNEGIFWVEVRIDRSRLVRESLLELTDVASAVDERLETARGSALSRLLALQTTSAERERVSNLIALIDALDPTFNRDDWNRRCASWRMIAESARRSLIFEVRSDPASREIARWLESQLASEQYSIRPGNCGSVDAVCIDIRSEIVEADVANRHVAKIRSFLSVLEPGGTVFREVDLTGRGDSKSDRGRARRHALDDLRRNLHASSVLSGLVEP
jgi:hypothetical protein